MTGPVPGGNNWIFQLEFDIDDQDLTSKLEILMTRLDTGLADFLQNDLVYYLQFRAAGRFMTEGDDATGPWAPLKPATEAIRRSKGYGGAHPINVRTTRLRDYILSDRGNVSPAGAGGWKLTYPAGATDLETRKKLETAQRGRQYPNTTERQVVALGMTDYNEILDSLSAFIVKDLM